MKKSITAIRNAVCAIIKSYVDIEDYDALQDTVYEVMSFFHKKSGKKTQRWVIQSNSTNSSIV